MSFLQIFRSNPYIILITSSSQRDSVENSTLLEERKKFEPIILQQEEEINQINNDVTDYMNFIVILKIKEKESV